MNVSSIVVRTKPAAVKSVIAALEKSGLCEVFFSDKQGRIVVTVEGETVDGEAEKLLAIQKLPDVLGADLVYAFSDDGE
ncbi:MAG: chaperone NapD [Candidatus Marinimicrobia bacterium]|nr:chaperone NapD [Candidatus Neomarinimicrobiota bacterium]